MSGEGSAPCVGASAAATVGTARRARETRSGARFMAPRISGPRVGQYEMLLATHHSRTSSMSDARGRRRSHTFTVTTRVHEVGTNVHSWHGAHRAQEVARGLLPCWRIRRRTAPALAAGDA